MRIPGWGLKVLHIMWNVDRDINLKVTTVLELLWVLGKGIPFESFLIFKNESVIPWMALNYIGWSFVGI